MTLKGFIQQKRLFRPENYFLVSLLLAFVMTVLYLSLSGVPFLILQHIIQT